MNGEKDGLVWEWDSALGEGFCIAWVRKEVVARGWGSSGERQNCSTSGFCSTSSREPTLARGCSSPRKEGRQVVACVLAASGLTAARCDGGEEGLSQLRWDGWAW